MSESNKVNGTILFTEEQIRQRAKELGQQISKDFEGESLYLVCTLRGGVVWMGDIMKNISNDTEIDFMSASSYGFTIDNLFVIGYGLDFNQKYRNLPYISYLDD